MAGDRLLTSRKDLWGRLKPISRALRHAQTDAEATLWALLRNRRAGPKFRRQHVIDQFIVDFYCPQARLVVEVDGAVHERLRSRDVARDRRLESMGFAVLRFTNEQVMHSADRVIADILAAVDARCRPNDPESGRN